MLLLYHNLLLMCLMRFLLLVSFLCVYAIAGAQDLDLDFVPYGELTDSQQQSVSQACTGRFVDGFDRYAQDVADGMRRSTAKKQSLKDQTWMLEGDAMLFEKSVVLLSNSIEIDQKSGQTLLNGQSNLRFDGLMLQGEEAEMDIYSNTGSIKNAHFVLHESNVNGSADEIRRDENGIFYLKRFSISRCNPNQKSWWLKGSSLKIDPNTGMLTSVHNWLWVAGIPVLYLPYIHMPFDDHATSGLLVPTFTFSSKGKLSEFHQPFYFRFKPNLDMTTTPSYLSQTISGKDKEGWLIDNEIRFLGWKHRGQLLGAYSNMPSQTQGDSLDNSDRYYLNYQQKWNLGWLTSDINLNALSDAYFFQDFYRGEQTDSALQTIDNVYNIDGNIIKQSIDASWALKRGSDKFHFFKHELNAKEDGWDVHFKQHWQRVDGRKSVEASEFQFQLAPAFEANYQSPSSPKFKFNRDVSLQVANFDRQLPDNLKENVDISEQLRMAATVQYEYPTEFKVGKTDAFYRFSPIFMLQGAVYPGFVAPKSKDSAYINAMTTLKQSVHVPFAINDEQQLLWQPELVWQYVPFVDTSYLPVLDSENKSSSFGDSTRFTGLDRLGDTSELHYGMSLQMQKNKKTHTQFSIKQSRLLEQERLNLQSLNAKSEEYERFSNYNVQARFDPNSAVRLTGVWAYSPDWEIRTSELGFKYSLPSNQYIRLTSNSYYDNKSGDATQTELSSHLISLSGQWALNYQVGLIGYGKWQYDVSNEAVDGYQLEEVAFGLEYDDCCWAFRMLSYNNYLDEEDVDNKIHFQIIFKGMGRLDQGFDAVVDKYLPAYPGGLFEQD